MNSIRTNELKKGKHFVFTNFNLVWSVPLPSDCKFVYQTEICPDTKKDHWQGYIEFPTSQNPKALLKYNNGFWSNRKGSQVQAYNYATKLDTRKDPLQLPISNFAPESKQGKRSDLDGMRSIILGKRSRADLYQEPLLDEVMAKFPKWVLGVFAHKPTPKNETFVPYPWQQSIIDETLLPPHPREIIWIYDTEGNKGKSSLCTYLATNYGALVIENCKTADIAYTYDNQSIVCWDLTRTTEDKVNYAPMEAIKNGRIFSPKYESTVKYFPKPHVIVVCNFKCPEGIFSPDRLRFICLDDTTTDSVEATIFNKDLTASAIQKRLKQRKALSLENYCKKCQLHKDVCRCLYREDSSPGMFETHL